MYIYTKYIYSKRCYFGVHCGLDGIVMLEKYRGKNAERTGLSRGNHALLEA